MFTDNLRDTYQLILNIQDRNLENVIYSIEKCSFFSIKKPTNIEKYQIFITRDLYDCQTLFRSLESRLESLGSRFFLVMRLVAEITTVFKCVSPKRRMGGTRQKNNL